MVCSPHRITTLPHDDEVMIHLLVSCALLPLNDEEWRVVVEEGPPHGDIQFGGTPGSSSGRDDVWRKELGVRRTCAGNEG